MAKVYAPFPIERTMCGLTFYKANGQNLVRKKSSLSRRRVKTGREFAQTRFHADLLKQASQIASAVYQALPAGWRQYWMFRAFTGEAMQWLKKGKTVEEVIRELKKVYVEELVKAQKTRGKKQDDNRQGEGQREKRRYIKKNDIYWNNKTIKANKRQAQKEKLQYYAGILAKASKIASIVYNQLPEEKRKYLHYKFFTGQVMRLLKEGLEEASVQEILKPVRKQYFEITRCQQVNCSYVYKKPTPCIAGKRLFIPKNITLFKTSGLFCIAVKDVALLKQHRFKRKRKKKTPGPSP